ncbi:hypothetical protein PAXRUDRAFT_828173 [Paxillus rubicundulus Ve08.2h10]|uniref:Uncharacterized protein n=1 Tax=Paxillus rubicundulus Ve08.2h10 TaxID=930991 RepID=A0A0D0DQ08_9AGAM|nr:hypothetical protein PAXRUDRAFT_828173 [Paxillus rubicundulus Ve08.2h10]
MRAFSLALHMAPSIAVSQVPSSVGQLQLAKMRRPGTRLHGLATGTTSLEYSVVPGSQHVRVYCVALIPDILWGY